jgi:murein DD-endopeptidase MepM/ murein hydrolase activator NlpD
LLHTVVTLLIVAGTAAVALPGAIPGNASSQTPAEAQTSVQAQLSFSFAAALQSQTAKSIAPAQPAILPPAAPIAQPPTDSLLLALVELGSAKTDAQLDASLNRIESLGLPAVVASTATATPDASNPDCVDSDSHPAFCVYTVKPGDTLTGIATTLSFKGNDAVSAAELLAQSNKPDVISSDLIEPGQNLRIPKQTGIIHTVITPESLVDVAAAYGVSADDIASSPFNALAAGALSLGQNVFVPDPQQVPATAASAGPADTPTPEPTNTPEPTSTPAPRVSATAPTATPIPPTPTAGKSSASPTPTKKASAKKGLYIWPVEGPISSYFGPSHPLGIDIDLFNNNDAPIKASRSGIVTFAGGDPCCSYGLYVIIDHGDNQQTLYAHLSAIGVHEGQSVGQGQVIGIGGRTGYATGYHLHFELHIDGNVVDPLLYLP